ncbi:heavy-metal-associated domain-containing protein [Stutzerimonas urumqiensis]|uniref:heavy-metal-associated domain-containing protein n=1 Tax=Stutzerimonas urumqiensis TaxID=638269 RepID=UPI000EB321C6|nr:cation transporter [Stutzerimonas urumqiensis]
MQTFNVRGMTCGHCSKAITQAIKARDDEARVDIDLPTGIVRVEAELSDEEVREAIREEGYEVQ